MSEEGSSPPDVNIALFLCITKLSSEVVAVGLLKETLFPPEDVSDIKVSYSDNLQGIKIKGELIPRLIDELPIIAILASQAEGKTVIKDAQDLRNKESDRITSVCREFSKLGLNSALHSGQ